jgi:hypothetical protein
MDDATIWFFGSYAIGTVLGLVWGYSAGAKGAIEVTIDQLVKNGFLRHRRKENGEVEILKFNHED